ncbi:MAG: hypothetical protein ACT4O9_02245 [Blastocatellia bacterium]
MKVIVLFAAFLALTNAASAQRAECFPLERLPAEKRAKANDLLLKALDSEALYTIVGGLKPMSSGFANFQIEVRPPRDEKKRAERRQKLADINETREILAQFKCGDEIFADVQHFAKTFDGKRFSEALVFHRPSLAAMIKTRSDFFDRWAITEKSHPLQVLFAIEYDETGARFGGYGYLFGYPEYAIRYFVQAADEEEFSGKFVERDFYSIPTFASASNRFVYAVPKGHKEKPEDRELKEKALKTFEEYKLKREQYVGDGKKGVVELLRVWLCDEQKLCEVSK